MPSASQLEKNYKIRDPIYGFIKLDAQEMDIVNSLYFQRLRRIKQLSLTDMVYPSANHTRFEHSLGVMQMASDMFDNIVAQEDNLKRLHLKKDDLKRTKKIIRLASLLHDIGHAPFSHAGEDSMPLLPENHPRYKPNEQKRYEHEDYSISTIKLLYKQLIEDHNFGEALGINVENITALLGDELVKPTRTSLIWKGLISGQLDADRADYLLRDSLHIGVNYGLYDRNRLVNCVTIGKSDESDCFLSIERGGLHVAESLVIARYQMFSQVYFHPVRRAFDYHIGQATKEVLKYYNIADTIFPEPTTQENLIRYLNFDDWKMYAAFKDQKCGQHSAIILKREPYKCKKEWDYEPSGNEITEIQRAINQFGGYLDRGAVTKWYKLDKDIMIFDNKSNKSFPLSYKSRLIEVMPGLPKVIRLFVNQENGGLKYEFPV